MKPIPAFLTVMMVLAIFFMIVRTAKADKVGVGNFVMAVSYTESYDDLQYVANFVNCDHAMDYYKMNCETKGAKIMMCQNEEFLYMPIDHNSDSSFDFEPTDTQSCGFVGLQKPKFVEE
jgi:hypothetical protein